MTDKKTAGDNVELMTVDADTAEVTVARRALSIPDFCTIYGISVRAFYSNQEAMPPTVNIGRRRVILVDSLPAWESELLRIAEKRTREKKREAA